MGDLSDGTVSGFGEKVKPQRREPNVPQAVDRHPELEARFAALHTSPAEGCWEWIGCPNRRPRFGVYERTVIAARFSYATHIAPVPQGVMVLHKCDNQRCVRPDHLYLGDHDTNMRDAKERGRSIRGERCWKAKGTAEDARRMREMAADGLSVTKIARAFDRHPGYVGRIIRGETWKYAGGPIRPALSREESKRRFQARIARGEPVGYRAWRRVG